MLTVIIILAVLILIGFIRVSVTAEYSSDGIEAVAKVGAIKVFSYPMEKKIETEKDKARKEKKKKKDKKGGKKADKEKKSGGFSEKFGGNVKMIIKLLPMIFKVLNKFRKKLIIRELTLHYTVACDDPYDTAVRYGEFTAGLSVIKELFTGFFKVKRCDMQTAFDFTQTEAIIYVKARLSLSIGRIIGIALTAGTSLLKILSENNNGKAVK